VTSRTLRADDYGLSEETKRLRDSEQGRLTDHAYTEANRLLSKHRPALDRVAAALLERETLSRDELLEIFKGVEPDSRSADAVGVVRALGE
jgi:cell division protease FtsH